MVFTSTSNRVVLLQMREVFGEHTGRRGPGRGGVRGVCKVNNPRLEAGGFAPDATEPTQPNGLAE